MSDTHPIPRADPLDEQALAALDSKQRMVVATAKLLQRQGYHATGMKQVVTEARAPRGSIYHHFPGGKDELAVQAVGLAADELTRVMTRALRTGDTPGGVLRRLGRSLSRWLEDSDYREGCPVSTVTLEVAPGHPALTEACRSAYDEWIGMLADRLVEAGCPADTARSLAVTTVAGIEGALLLCRAQRSTTAMAQVVGHLADVLDDAVGEAG